MNLQRRISAAFKDISGGQFLGATYDYTHRLLDFDLLSETLGETSKTAAASAAGDASDAEKCSSPLKA
jgi:alpha-D-ribose 1-methylphosphonate 5-triphosphate synthase subunit PhnI